MARCLVVATSLLLISLSAIADAFEVVGDDEFPPFSYTNEQKQIVGIDVDIVRELGQRINVNFEIKLVPWKRLLALTENGAVFGSFSLFQTPEREEFALFTHPVHYSTYKLYSPKDKIFDFETTDDLFGKRIGINAGFVVSEELELAAARGDFTLIELFHNEETFHRMLRGGLDAFVGNEFMVNFQLQNAEARDLRSEIVSLPKTIKESRGAYFVVSKKFPVENREQWVQTITNELQRMEHDGTTAQIIKRYVD